MPAISVRDREQPQQTLSVNSVSNIKRNFGNNEWNETKTISGELEATELLRIHYES
jgi:hypothetical protein